MSIKLLIIGAVPKKGMPSTYGGTTILLQTLIDFFIEKGIRFKLIPTNKFAGKLSKIINFIYVVFKVVGSLPFYEIVMLNGANKSSFLLGPLIYYPTRLFRKKFIFRKFAGNFAQMFNLAPAWKKWLARKTIFRSDMILAETRGVVDFFRNHESNNIRWFPNVRKRPEIMRNERPYQKRFVFIGHVIKSKGIFEILAVGDKLPDDYLIDIYGPFKNKTCSEKDFENSPVNYCGILSPNEVIPTLVKYDVLLLPSHREGYPGIIIESFSVGLPIVASRLPSLEEIAKNDENAILVEPKNVDQLYQSILSFNQEKYSRMSKKAAISFNHFDRNIVYSEFIKWLEQL